MLFMWETIIASTASVSFKLFWVCVAVISPEG